MFSFILHREKVSRYPLHFQSRWCYFFGIATVLHAQLQLLLPTAFSSSGILSTWHTLWLLMCIICVWTHHQERTQVQYAIRLLFVCWWCFGFGSFLWPHCPISILNRQRYVFYDTSFHDDTIKFHNVALNRVFSYSSCFSIVTQFFCYSFWP